MSVSALITYATKYGSTKEIAEKIAEIITQAGIQADILPIKQVKNLTEYQAVIMGSAVYIGGWRKEAVKFVNGNQSALSRQLVWIFSSGPTGDGDPVELLKGWRLPKKLQATVDQIKPQDIAVFHGKVMLEELSGLHRWMVKKVDSPVGDYRDWEMISKWAAGIAEQLKSKL